MHTILATFLEKTQITFVPKLETLRSNLSTVSRIHIDVIEQSFADNQTLFPQDWPAIPSDVAIDAHLMVERPIEWIDVCQQAGVTTMIGHIEKVNNMEEFVKTVKKKGMKVGMAIDLPTKIDDMKARKSLRAFEDCDQILLMSITAGFAGQQFEPRVLEKIQAVRQLCPNCAEIAADGGINLETAKQSFDAGANVLAVNTFLWQNFEINLRKLRNLA